MSSFDKLMAEAEQWHRDHPWQSRWLVLKARADRVWSWRWGPLCVWQRYRRGFSFRDAWSFDTYFAGVIAEAAEYLKEVKYGHPIDMTEAEWHAYLDSVSGPLRRYSDGDPKATYDEDTAAYTDAVAAMHRFADKFGSFWD
ncbi:hypothetical protein [Streptomyces sp. S1]|uniref:hypothetical protein n=1 Tax=Streptomyces sp. S1 TaxID=718288 RepID=UPI003D70C7CF